MATPTLSRAITAIERRGVLLVYPVKNAPEPPSLWHELHPRTPMRWAWDETADDRVVELWHLRERLARSGRVVYGKWWSDRATFFSVPLFRAMLATLREHGDLEDGLSPASRRLLESVHDDSPLPTKRLRERAGLAGREHESTFHRAMRPLWRRLLLVGVGEEAEGGFPSLAVGATRLLRESIWLQAADPTDADRALIATVAAKTPSFGKAFRRVRRELEGIAG